MQVVDLSCTGEPISWPRLETFAAGAPDASIDEHVRTCAACRHCLDALRADNLVLPALNFTPAKAPAARPRWRAWIPALGVAMAAVVLALVVIRRPDSLPQPDVAVRENVATVKGVGTVVLGTVRERAGEIRQDAATFATGDRWKLVLTCAPGPSVRAKTSVIEVSGDGRVDRPLPLIQVSCGNRVVLPGAFELTGARANRVCVQLDGSATACVTIEPE